MTCTTFTWTDKFFDFLMGGKTVSLSTGVINEEEKGTGIIDHDHDNKKESLILYTLNTESEKCPLDCLIISVRLRLNNKLINQITQIVSRITLNILHPK